MAASRGNKIKKMTDKTLITFDGFAGAGKTTQMNKLSERLKGEGKDVYSEGLDKGELHIIKGPLDRVQKHLAPSKQRGIIGILDKLSSIKHAQAKQWDKDGFVLTSWFWDVMVEYGADDSLLSAFRHILCASNGFEPTASFWLKAPNVERTKRRTKRQNPSIETIKMAESKRDRNYDKKINKSIELLASRLPYFYVIDGTLPQDEIAEIVYAILLKHTQIW